METPTQTADFDFARARWLLVGGSAMGVLGLLLGANAFVLAVPPL